MYHKLKCNKLSLYFLFFFRRRQHLSTHFKVKGGLTVFLYEGRWRILAMQMRNAEDSGCHGFSSRWLVHFVPPKSYIIKLRYSFQDGYFQYLHIYRHLCYSWRIVEHLLLRSTWWHAAELLGENIKAVYCSSVLAILRWTLWDSQKLMYTTKWDQEVSLAKFKLWQYGAERAERIMTVLNYSEELPLFSELKACQVVLFCHDRDSRALKAV